MNNNLENNSFKENDNSSSDKNNKINADSNPALNNSEYPIDNLSSSELLLLGATTGNNNDDDDNDNVARPGNWISDDIGESNNVTTAIVNHNTFRSNLNQLHNYETIANDDVGFISHYRDINDETLSELFEDVLVRLINL